MNFATSLPTTELQVGRKITRTDMLLAWKQNCHPLYSSKHINCTSMSSVPRRPPCSAAIYKGYFSVYMSTAAVKVCDGRCRFSMKQTWCARRNEEINTLYKLN
jgi:hypothetical protein